MVSLVRIILSALLVAAATLRAFEPGALGGESLLPPDWAASAERRDAGPRELGTPVLAIALVNDDSGARFAEVLRVTTQHTLSKYYLAELAVPTNRSVKKGDTLWLRFWFRTLSAQNEQGEAELCAYFQQKSDPWGKSITHRVSVGREWSQLELPFTAKHDLAAGEATLNLGVGFRPQSLEIAGLELWRFPSSVRIADLPRTRYTYEGRDARAAWRTAAFDRIQKIRTAPLTVIVRDKSGLPVKNAKVAVRQVRNAFDFGTSVDSALLLKQTPDADRYRRALLENFNTAVIENGFKWPRWQNQDPSKGWPRRETLAALDWLSAQNLTLRGHNLVWPGWKYTPESARPPAISEGPVLRRAVSDHIADVMAATRGKLDEWDVVNEALHERDYFTLLPETAVMAEWFKQARAADPKPRLFINDFDMLTGGGSAETVERMLTQVATLKTAGAPVEGIGVQGHFGQALLPPERILHDLDRLATAGLPIVITEFDINTPDEDVQGDFTRDFLIACYSHPAVTGLVTWGFWEKSHWLPQAAMFRADWSERPNAAAWRALVNDAWRSHPTGRTDADGRFEAVIHRGDYVVALGDGPAHAVSVTADGATLTLTLP